MPLKIVKRGKYCNPMVICDHCNKPITDATDGNYMWQEKDPGRQDEIFFTHKHCFTPFERSHPDGGHWMAGELPCFMVYLANGLKLDWPKAVDQATKLSSIG